MVLAHPRPDLLAGLGNVLRLVEGGKVLLFDGAITRTEIPPARPITRAAGNADRGRMMPKRARTRAQECAQRIKAERARNAAELADSGSDPPF